MTKGETELNANPWRGTGVVFLALLVAWGAGVANAQSPKRDMTAHNWQRMADDYRKRGNDAKALEAYDKAFEAAGKSRNWLPISATLFSAEIRLRKLDTKEALKTLDRYDAEDIKKMSAPWRLKMLRTRGRILAAQGRETEAWAAFKKALAVEHAQ